MVNLNGRDYFVDQELRKSRSAGDHSEATNFVRFDSAEGHTLWDQCLIAKCAPWEVEKVEPRHAMGIKCRHCGQWVLA